MVLLHSLATEERCMTEVQPVRGPDPSGCHKGTWPHCLQFPPLWVMMQWIYYTGTDIFFHFHSHRPGLELLSHVYMHFQHGHIVWSCPVERLAQIYTNPAICECWLCTSWQHLVLSVFQCLPAWKEKTAVEIRSILGLLLGHARACLPLKLPTPNLASKLLLWSFVQLYQSLLSWFHSTRLEHESFFPFSL